MEYKYNYQDWVEGKVPQFENFDPTPAIIWRAHHWISSDDYEKIDKMQSDAYKYLVEQDLQEFISIFIYEGYQDSCKQYYDIAHTKANLERDIEEFKRKHLQTYKQMMAANVDGHESLSYEEIQLIYSESFANSDLSRSFVAKDHPLSLLSYLNRLQWLVWFEKQEQERFESIQKQRYLTAISAESKDDLIEKTASKYYTWPNLFLDIKQAEKIINYISEYLSDTGQWVEEPKGRHLMALYSELKQKGFLKSTLTAPKVANAINNQFGTDLDSKNFQPGMLKEADEYRKNFQHIPQYQPNSNKD